MSINESKGREMGINVMKLAVEGIGGTDPEFARIWHQFSDMLNVLGYSSEEIKTLNDALGDLAFAFIKWKRKKDAYLKESAQVKTMMLDPEKVYRDPSNGSVHINVSTEYLDTLFEDFVLRQAIVSRRLAAAAVRLINIASKTDIWDTMVKHLSDILGERHSLIDSLKDSKTRLWVESPLDERHLIEHPYSNKKGISKTDFLPQFDENNILRDVKEPMIVGTCQPVTGVLEVIYDNWLYLAEGILINIVEWRLKGSNFKDVLAIAEVPEAKRTDGKRYRIILHPEKILSKEDKL